MNISWSKKLRHTVYTTGPAFASATFVSLIFGIFLLLPSAIYFPLYSKSIQKSEGIVLFKFIINYLDFSLEILNNKVISLLSGTSSFHFFFPQSPLRKARLFFCKDNALCISLLLLHVCKGRSAPSCALIWSFSSCCQLFSLFLGCWGIWMQWGQPSFNIWLVSLFLKQVKLVLWAKGGTFS